MQKVFSSVEMPQNRLEQDWRLARDEDEVETSIHHTYSTALGDAALGVFSEQNIMHGVTTNMLAEVKGARSLGAGSQAAGDTDRDSGRANLNLSTCHR